ncbi:hypothetical protein [Sanguibacter suaedae]|uniref:Uncharacterized protein n=1 Tax=Sanguibacter suaedae TaxID=2795737 RepID=A0A934I618_9MICO|nr:hypothetical protein [Sanguibacter suaedae]MBI9115908.1 hypothetical protein [Sanguibacter suaedae]
MPIPRRKIPAQLATATPTELTVDDLKRQLTDIGLTCPDSAEDKLQEYITEVESQLQRGSTETLAILRPATDPTRLAAGLGALHEDWEKSSEGNWTPDATGFGYGPDLEYIQFPTHFDWLAANNPRFAGVANSPPTYTGDFDSVSAVKMLFVNVALDASSTLVKGLDKASMQSVLSNAISPLSDANAKNYEPGPDTRVIFLVENYDPSTQEADAIGVLTIWWDLKIHDYKKKSKDDPKHRTSLEVRARSVLYSSVEELKADVLAVETHFKSNAFMMIPKPTTEVTIFEKRPPATRDTFVHSLPKVATEDSLQAIVLFAPNLQNVGCIDNTASPTTTTYSKSITSGFTFSTTQTLGAEAAFEATVLVAKVNFKVTFSISFTEQWSEETTETFSFSVPPGEKAFTYQGYLLAQILTFDAATGTYSYGKPARFVTNILTTSAEPLVDPT